MLINLNETSILLGVTGSISAYKACDLARLFVKAGAQVHVVMSPSAERFVSALTFEALTRNPVLTEVTENWSSELNHIEIGKKCDAFVVAPATANSLNKLSKGIADNILLQTALAYAGPMLVAPAANTQMLKNHYTAGSLKMLKVNDYTVIEPQEKLLACGDIGTGALAEPLDIFFETAKALLKDPFWTNRRKCDTSPTIHPGKWPKQSPLHFISREQMSASLRQKTMKGSPLHSIRSISTVPKRCLTTRSMPSGLQKKGS